MVSVCCREDLWRSADARSWVPGGDAAYDAQPATWSWSTGSCLWQPASALWTGGSKGASEQMLALIRRLVVDYRPRGSGARIIDFTKECCIINRAANSSILALHYCSRLRLERPDAKAAAEDRGCESARQPRASSARTYTYGTHDAK